MVLRPALPGLVLYLSFYKKFRFTLLCLREIRAHV